MITKTPYKPSEIEFIERKSRFISNIFIVYSEAEAKDCIEKVSREHKTANHVVYAYDIHSENATRFSDAGEPKGTAGMPVYEIFRREELTCYCCTVVRYFGGILLGAGGLIRAYANSAKLALEAAGIAQLMPYTKARISCEYSHYDIITSALKGYECEVENTDFLDRVGIDMICPEAEFEKIRAEIINRTSGRTSLIITDSVMRPQKI